MQIPWKSSQKQEDYSIPEKAILQKTLGIFKSPT